MRLPLFRTTFVGALALAGVLLAYGVHRRGLIEVATATTQLVALPAVGGDAAIRDRDIAFYTARMAGDPGGASDRSSLAALLFARGRSTGSAADLAHAEALAHESVALRAEHNGSGFELLASILMAQHAFRDARVVMQRADSLAPGTPSHLALLAEIELELGEYASAATHFTAVRYDGDQFTVGARMARWYELTGRAELARRVLRRAIDRVDRRDDLPRDQVAWFHYRLGDLELRLGNHDAADSAFARSLAVNADDVRALGGLAHSAAARGQWRHAIGYGERALAVQLDPATVAVMSVAYAALGDSVQATSYANTVRALEQPGPVHRAVALFLLDHGTSKDRAQILRRARASLRNRYDIYGHDLLAWALYRNGDRAEAQVHMAMAGSQRTEDVMLGAHARAIMMSE